MDHQRSPGKMAVIESLVALRPFLTLGHGLFILWFITQDTAGHVVVSFWVIRNVLENSERFSQRFRFVNQFNLVIISWTLKTIVTAAHCCDKAQHAKIWTGQHRTDRWDSGEKVFWASSIHIHPDYDNKSFEHDVCILKVDDLAQGMDLANNSVADFACLPSGKIFGKILSRGEI